MKSIFKKIFEIFLAVSAMLLPSNVVMAQDVDEFVEVVALLVAISGGDDFERKMDITGEVESCLVPGEMLPFEGTAHFTVAAQDEDQLLYKVNLHGEGYSSLTDDRFKFHSNRHYKVDLSAVTDGGDLLTSELNDRIVFTGKRKNEPFKATARLAFVDDGSGGLSLIFEEIVIKTVCEEPPVCP